MDAYLVAPVSTVYRQIRDELVVVQLDTGRYFFFNPETKSVLDSFRTAQSVQEYCESHSLNEDDAKLLREFCQFLLETGILKETNQRSELMESEILPFEKPTFLRSGEKTLDQISFLCP